MNNPTKVRVYAWSLSLLVTIVAIVAWLQTYNYQLTGLSTYQVFPLLGLLAFSIMWSHYMAGVMRRALRVEKSTLKSYFAVTSYLVLAAILLHPGLLIWQLYRDGAGLPPASYIHYVAPGLGWVTLLGTTSFVIFMLYELHRKFGTRSWWKYVQYASDLAMFLIFYHALRLGGALRLGWFQAIWYLYGATLAAALVYTYGFQDKAAAK